MIRIQITSNGSHIVYSTRKWFNATNLNVYLVLFEFLLVLYCIFCDYVIYKSNNWRRRINSITAIDMRVITVLMDNGSHAFIALLSWLIVRIPHLPVKELLLSAFIGSIIDIDHFISAKSTTFDAALSLPTRPFMHNTFTLCVITFFIFLLLTIYANKYRYLVCLVFLSWFSHHLRDANRHGLWFGGDNKTPALKSEFYISLTCILPLLFRLLLLYFKI